MNVSSPSTPLEFWVSLGRDEDLALDEVVYCQRPVGGHGMVSFYGVVEEVQMVLIDSLVDYQAKVKITRIAPEVFVPPTLRAAVNRAGPEQLAQALHFDGMKHKLPVGLLASGHTAYANVDFLNGKKGAHVNISGISGVATKTSYALFLLYSLFHTPQPKPARAILFNIKGDDLLYLDRPNALLSDHDREVYQKLGLPCTPFPQVTYHGNQQGLWTLKEFAERAFVQFLFVDTEPSAPQDFAIEHIAELLQEAAQSPGPDLVIKNVKMESLQQLCEHIAQHEDEWFEKATPATRQAILRRLKSAARLVEPLLKTDQSFHYDSQLTVIDLHRYHERARAFVIGAVLKTLFDQRELQGDDHPTVYLLVDELNKYAPRQSSNAIKEMLLDIAERGRSLGLILLGAEQTASAVEPRVVGNAALRIVGRLEAGESQSEEYTWLTPTLRQRACLIQPGTMILSQPDVPVPLLLRFPFPAWATRSSQAQP